MKTRCNGLVIRKHCGISTGIDGGLTFGTGKLDDYGYWEFPCDECRDHYLTMNHPGISCYCGDCAHNPEYQKKRDDAILEHVSNPDGI